MDSMASPATIPLFPLPLSVLPGEAKPLHIFEDRYRKLVKDCRTWQAEGSPAEFGILFVTASGMAHIGTAVVISRILKEHPDGRVDILVEGTRRFRLNQLVCKDLYDRGEVAWLEEPGGDWDDGVANQVYQLHQQLLAMALDARLPDGYYSGAVALSLRIAPACGMDCAQKQKLLELDSENERLRLLRTHLSALVASMQRVAESARVLRDFWAVHQFLSRPHNGNGPAPPPPSNSC